MRLKQILGVVFALLVFGIANSAHAQTATPTLTATASPSASPTATPIVTAGGITVCGTASSTSLTMFQSNGGRRGLKCQNSSASVVAYYAVGALANGGTGCQAPSGAQGNAFELPESQATTDNSITYAPGATTAGSSAGGAPTGDITVCTASSTALVCCMQW